jgi:hypothetical protein
MTRQRPAFDRLRAKFSRCLLAARTTWLWSVEAILIATWVTTLGSLGKTVSYSYLVDAGAILVFLYVLFFAEGLELAVADLLDKHPEQLADTRTQRLLRELQSRRDFFFGTRQVFVVLIISFMSLRTTYPWISVPFVGRVSDYEAPFWFSLLFTSLTVLWCCQVTPKRLAVLNSELFLRQSAFLWPIIKLIGLLGLPNPSDQLVHLFQRFTAYRRRRHLHPSPASHYNTTSQIYGAAVDRLHVDVAIGSRREAIVRRRFVVLFLHGGRTQHSGILYSASAFSSMPTVTVKGLFVGEVPERLEAIDEELEAIFIGQPVSRSSMFAPVGDWPFVVECKRETDLLRGGESARWTVRSLRPLPEALWPLDDRAEPTSTSMAVLVYEMEFSLADGGVVSRHGENAEEHVWPEYVDVPCRRLTLNVRPMCPSDTVVLQGCDVRLLPGDIPLARHTARCTQRAIAAHDGKFDLRYPLQGAVYSVRWSYTGSQQPNDSTAEAPVIAQTPNESGEPR